MAFEPAFFLLLFLSSVSFATPQIVRVDGSIFDAAGAPSTGDKDIQIKAYDAASAGTLLWTSSVYNTAISSGRFTINMDAASGSTPSLVTQIGARTASEGIYFQVEVDTGAANGSMDSAQIVRPRIRAKGTMYALVAAKADAIAGVTTTVSAMNSLAGITTALAPNINGITANVQTQLNTLAASLTVNNAVAAGRLTPSSGTPVTLTAVTGATTIYYTPYVGNQISIYDGSKWRVYSFSELSLSLSGYTANKNYDVFVYDNSGTLTLESTVWTNDTTRATALTRQDGVWVRSGGAGHNNRRFLGTFRTTGTTGRTELSNKLKLISNVGNTVMGSLQAADTSGYYANSDNVVREANGASTYGVSRVGFVLAEPQVVSAWNSDGGYNTGGVGFYGTVGIGLDSVTLMSGISAYAYTRDAYDGWAVTATFSEIVSAGYHYLARLERAYGLYFAISDGTDSAVPYQGGMKVNLSH